MKYFIKFCKAFSIILLVVFQTVFCKPEWYEAKDGTKFLIENQEEYNWYDAFYECADRNLKLLAIESEQKNNALKEVLFVNLPQINNLWIGGYDKFNENPDRSRPFYWIDGDLTAGKQIYYTNWASRQPDNFKRREHCVHIFANSFSWNDNSCHKQEFGFICEEKDLKHNKEETLNDKVHQDEDEQSNQRDNTDFTRLDDMKTAGPLDEEVSDITGKKDWIKYLQNRYRNGYLRHVI